MKKIRKLTKSKKLRTMLLLALLSFVAIPLEAATVTLKTQTGGKFRYCVETGVGTGSYGSWSSYVTANTNVTVANGRRIRIQAIPTSTSYYFVNWTGYSTLNYYYNTITINENRTYTANFTTSYKTVKLSVNYSNYGSAKIYGPFEEQTITTQDDTSIKVGVGATVRLTATPADNSHWFTKWTSDGETSETVYRFTFAVSANVNYKALFTVNSRTVDLSINTANSGSVKISGPFADQTITSTSNTTVTVGSGATITLTATPASNYYFVNYTGTYNGNASNPTQYVYTRTVSANCSYKANFTTSYKNIQVKINTAGYGSTVVSGPFADKTVTSTSYQTYKVGVGATVTLTSTPASGKYWMYYSVNGNTKATEATTSYTVSADRTYMANFTTSYQTITLQVQTGGKVRLHDGVSYTDYSTTTLTKKVGLNSTCTVQAIPNDDTHYFVKWTEGSATANTSYSWSFTATGDKTYLANFTTSHKTITATASPTAGGRVRVFNGWQWTSFGSTATAEVGVGATCKVHAESYDGYGFLNWTKGGTEITKATAYSFVASAAATYQANFADVWEGDLTAGRTYTVTTTSGNKFKVTCSNTSDVFHNQTYSYIGNLNANSGTVTISFKNSAAALMLGTIAAKTGATLNLNATGGNRTLKKANNTDYMISSDLTSTMKINSTKQYTLTLDGGSVYTTPGDGRTEWDRISPQGCVIYVQGDLEIYKSVVQNSCRYNHGGAFYITSGETDGNTFYNLTAEDVTIRGCQAASIFDIIGNDYHRINLTRVKFEKNMQIAGTRNGVELPNDANGIFRTHGNSKCIVVMDNCEYCYNKAESSGGAIYWNATGIPSDQPNGTKCTIQNGTKIHHNVADIKGGAMYLSGTGEIRDSEIYNNEAAYYGGGLYVEPNGGGHDNFPGAGPSLTIGDGTQVYGNSAGQKGGGIYFTVTYHNDVGWDPNGTPLSPEFKMEIKSGGYIYDNSAPKGAGVAIIDDAANKHKNNNQYQSENYPLPNPAYNVWSGVYKRNVVISGGAVYGNHTVGSNTSGAGIYIEKTTNTKILDGTVGYTYTDSNLPDAATNTGAAGTITVDIKGGLVYNNEAINGVGGGLSIQDIVKSTYPAYGSLCDVLVRGTAQIYGNKAGTSGGGIYVGSGNLTMSAGKVGCNTFNFTDAAGTTYNNVSGANKANTGNGGGFYVSGGTVTVTGGSIAYNEAANNGGGFYVNVSKDTDLTTIKNGATVLNNQAKNGGGAFINKGKLVIQDAATKVNSNTATTSGGGIYMANGTVTFTNAKLQSNTATSNDGGGLYLGNGTITVSGANTAIQTNKANSHGGGVYVGGGTLTMTGGVIGGTTSQGNSTTASAGYGGGLYMGGGTATISGGSISGNKSTGGYGGGVYMNGGTCTLSNGATIGGASATYANSSKYGGGIYSAGGTITVKGGKIQYNSAATGGGGIYTNGAEGVVNVEKQSSKADVLSYIEYNTAQEGGGIYANRGVVNFSDGYIQYNYASNAGGGIYVNRTSSTDYGKLYLKGSANLNYNSVPEGHDGGGVYLKGRIIVGEAGATGRIMAQTNFAGDSYSYTWENTGHPETDSIDHILTNNRNNVYLPQPEVRDDHTDVIEIIENGISMASHVGFSVDHGNVPVIYCDSSATSRAYLHQFSTGQNYQYNVFDDTRRYIAVQYDNQPDVFDPDHVYLYGFWANVVTGDPTHDYCEVTANFNANPIQITTPCDLAYFISWVNGLNGLEAHPNANAILMDDIDMSEFGWVPIGKTDEGYGGTFDGNGHTVTGLVGLLYREYLDYGFFGKLNSGAKVKDLFVNGASFYLEENGSPMVVGGLAGEINNNVTISNSEVASNIYVENTGSVAGGLIGRQNGGTVHSTIGIADMTGYIMGGLVGELLGGNLYNSFSNCKFTKADPGHQMYMGGLVAVNRGTVENCYARRRGSVPKGKFGILVGDNTDGLMTCCYAPAGETNYKVIGNSLMGHGNYGDTYLPYLYGHRDTQISLANNQNNYVPSFDGLDKQMLLALNSWVDANSNASVTYTKWGRPWHESDAVKPLNDDYPILKMPKCEAVGAKKGNPYLYYNPIDDLLVRYTDAESAIWLYRNPDNVVRGNNSASAAKLYIAEDVALINLNELKAYVGITLDNSAGLGGVNPTYGNYLGITTDATDWHMFSTPLSNAPLGINYSDGAVGYGFSWGHPSAMPYYLFYQKGDAKNGYFPQHRFGKEYPSSDAIVQPGNYYQEWDFYAYYEPEYHWINFKRNSWSHRHFDTEQHDTIFYHNGDPALSDDFGNESRLVPGKGYFAATREETFMQCQGTLNNSDVEYGLTQTTGVPRHGYNLLGNPYLAYLDFNKFAEANSGDDVDVIWDSLYKASYTILDEDSARYITFVYDASNNPPAAGRFIHPHQGFFVLLRNGEAATAHFEPAMRNATDTVTSIFRNNDHIDYPLVNLFVSEANGNSDMVTVELGRPNEGGATLMQGLRAGNGKIWCHYNDKDYAVAYTQPGITEVAIRFESVENTEYTMRWNTYNGDFSYLHLIDNMTGADVDCLSQSEYRFSASTSDYKSRFRLVFGYTGIEEDIEAEVNQNFAFFMGDELVVTGEGVLQVFDVTGRMLVNQELHGVQTMVALPNVANGIYVMRLTEGKQSRVQKMVISK